MHDEGLVDAGHRARALVLAVVTGLLLLSGVWAAWQGLLGQLSVERDVR